MPDRGKIFHFSTANRPSWNPWNLLPIGRWWAIFMGKKQVGCELTSIYCSDYKCMEYNSTPPYMFMM
jgi:hypothetical protein